MKIIHVFLFVIFFLISLFIYQGLLGSGFVILGDFTEVKVAENLLLW